MSRITKAQMEERFNEILDNVSRAQQLEKEQANAFWEKEALEYELKIANLQGQIEVYEKVLGYERPYIAERIENADKQ